MVQDRIPYGPEAAVLDHKSRPKSQKARRVVTIPEGYTLNT